MDDLDDAALRRIELWRQRTFPGGLECPLCHMSHWKTRSRLRALPTLVFDNGTPMVDAQAITAAVELACENCGHLLLFGAIAAGALES